METLQQLVQEGARRFDKRPALLDPAVIPHAGLAVPGHCSSGAGAARVLVDAGLEPGDRAIIWAVNRPEWGLAFLALAHAGAVVVPLDVRHTVDFGRKVAGQTGARIVIASKQTEASARALGLPIIWVESLPDLARHAEPLPAAPIDKDTLAEIVFTSGTTGEPKGAMLTHGNIMACATSMSQVMHVAANDRLLSVLPLSHLYEQVLGSIGPLMTGASVVYPVSRQPAVLLRTFRDFRVTILLIVPQGLRLLDGAIERKVDQAGSRARFEQMHGLARHLPRGARRLLFRARAAGASAAICTRSASAPRRSRSTSPSAGPRWESRSCRDTEPRRWDPWSRSPARSATSSGRWASRSPAWTSGSPTTVRSWRAVPTGSWATGRTPRPRPKPSTPMAGTTWVTWAASRPTACSTSAAARRTWWRCPTGRRSTRRMSKTRYGPTTA